MSSSCTKDLQWYFIVFYFSFFHIYHYLVNFWDRFWFYISGNTKKYYTSVYSKLPLCLVVAFSASFFWIILFVYISKITIKVLIELTLYVSISWLDNSVTSGGSRTAATSKMERFVIIVNVNYYHRALHLGWWSASGNKYC